LYVATAPTLELGVQIRHRVPALVGERRRVERCPLYSGPHVRLLRPDHLDPHAWLLHRLREVAAQRRPRLVGVPAVLKQQILDQCAHWRFDGHLPF
jgi:hypothetical protein